MATAIDIQKMKEHINEYFDTHSQQDILKKYYKDTLETIDKFDKDLWARAIDEQVSIGDEECWYTDDENKKQWEPLFEIFHNGVGHQIADRHPWTPVENTDFPTMFMIFEDKGNKIAVVLMIGQGSAIDVCPVDEMEKWMKRIGGKYEMPEALSLDDLEKLLNRAKYEINVCIQSASTEVKKKKIVE